MASFVQSNISKQPPWPCAAMILGYMVSMPGKAAATCPKSPVVPEARVWCEVPVKYLGPVPQHGPWRYLGPGDYIWKDHAAIKAL